MYNLKKFKKKRTLKTLYIGDYLNEISYMYTVEYFVNTEMILQKHSVIQKVMFKINEK